MNERACWGIDGFELGLVLGGAVACFICFFCSRGFVGLSRILNVGVLGFLVEMVLVIVLCS